MKNSWLETSLIGKKLPVIIDLSMVKRSWDWEYISPEIQYRVYLWDHFIFPLSSDYDLRMFNSPLMNPMIVVYSIPLLFERLGDNNKHKNADLTGNDYVQLPKKRRLLPKNILARYSRHSRYLFPRKTRRQKTRKTRINVDRCVHVGCETQRDQYIYIYIQDDRAIDAENWSHGMNVTVLLNRHANVLLPSPPLTLSLFLSLTGRDSASCQIVYPSDCRRISNS